MAGRLSARHIQPYSGPSQSAQPSAPADDGIPRTGWYFPDEEVAITDVPGGQRTRRTTAVPQRCPRGRRTNERTIPVANRHAAGPPERAVPGIARPDSVVAVTGHGHRRCPQLYRFLVIDRIPENPSPAALRGTVVHAALENLHNLPARQRTPETAQALLGPNAIGLHRC